MGGKLTAFILFFMFVTQVATAQQPPVNRIMFVFDASQSMVGRWQSDIKMNIAKKLMGNLLDSLSGFENLELALRVYGHQKPYPPLDCTDTRLEVPFGSKNTALIKKTINSMQPRGSTPVAFSLQQAANDFPAGGNSRNFIILITDGIEECSGDPCAVSLDLQRRGIVMKPFIIGIGKNFRDAFDCVGTYFDASSEDAFQNALNTTISQALGKPTLQVNLLDEDGKPTETDVTLTFTDMHSGAVRYNFIHTFNQAGLPDTLVLDALSPYHLRVHTIPPVDVDSVKLQNGRHTVVHASVPQGQLQVHVNSSGKPVLDIQAIVRRSGSSETLALQRLNEEKKYLAGTYDIEVLTLPRMYFPGRQIKQSETTVLEVPVPGIVQIRKSILGTGALFSLKPEGQVRIYDLRPNELDEILILQPGSYRIVFRAAKATSTAFSITRDFTVNSGASSAVNLYKY